MNPNENVPWPWSAGVTDKFVQNYTKTYFEIAADIGPEGRVCEVGIWKGHGLKFFQAIFPFGQVTGVDFNDEPQSYWPEGVTKVLAHQNDPRLPEFLGHGTFDLIVDDASHVGNQTTHTFKMLWPLVAPGGYYVVEDWSTELPDMVEMAANLLWLLPRRNSACDWIKYEHRLAIVHRRKYPARILEEPPGVCYPSPGNCQSPFHGPYDPVVNL